MAINGPISNTIIKLANPYGDITLIKQAITRLQVYSVNVENCGYPLACQSCQTNTCQTCQSYSCQSYTCQTCQSGKPSNCNCSDGNDTGGY